MKKLFSVLAIAVIVVMAISCVKEVKLTGIALDKATLALKVGEEATLNVSYTPEDASDITAATWETSAPAVATVEAGKVKAVGEGSATITAKVGTFTATCQVTVTKDEEPGPGPEPEPTEPEDNWNYTPGADYQAAGNLWKPVDDAATVKYFYYHCEGTDWNGTETEATEVPFLKKTQSTYRLYYEASTGADWQNQFFMYPFDESHFIALDPSRKYKFSVTIGTNNNCNGFFKLSKYNPNGAPKYEGDCIWEGGRVALSAAEPKVFECEFAGVEASNIILVMDFGANPEKTYIYIKDITLVDEGEAEPNDPVEYNWNFTPSAAYNAANNLWKAVDAAHTIEWYYNPNWEGEKEAPAVAFEQSTYSVTIADACPSDWNAQMWIRPASEFKLDPAKKYKFSATFGANTNGAFFMKLYQKDHNESMCFDITPRVELKAAEDYTFEVAEFTPIDAPLDLLIDFSHHPANTTFYIKDITIVEIVAPQSVSEICALEKGAEVVSAESLVAATTTMGFIATDGSKAIYVYTNKTDFNGVAKVGDKVKFAGSKTVFNGVHEVEKVTSVEVVSSGNAVTYPEAKDITSEVATYDAPEAEYVTLVGTLSKSGNYYNLTIDGVDAATKQGSITYPTADLNVDSFDGKKIRVTGYFNGLSSKGKFVNIIATSVTE